MDRIRIGSGKLRGRYIASPQSRLVHPMGSREKLALFNMITDRLPGARVLDAFAGSGALGIEAISRGAKECVFVEKNPRVAKNLTRNLQDLDLIEVGEVYIGDVNNLSEDKGLFDVIVADPPYDNFRISDIVYLTKFLKNSGILVLSHPPADVKISDLKLLTTRRYAGAQISVYEN